MFIKIDRKILLVVILLILVLIGSFFLYKNLNQNNNLETQQENLNKKDNTLDQKEKPQIQLNNPDIEVQGGGGLFICSDLCGDGICQKTEPTCKNGSLNCICPETPQECPQDCK
ncbi:MAG: hypothetical protein A3C58_03625 [Candidatus Staskawiczbacteria bacterium RIFCSPHIGHO2_02_FULL_34_10]|uniref:Uncharacterized protein n=2 Tax=Candidatus Staskawicziibacteriota TaxID=1817916 RepID=A0A1G2HJQ7_9BACT|nr:MAG: hypothetical protein A2639_01310 [Candidatus Staskawiczbacteria bacterium RIFCSPHIGHO2_01_FULL_34_27]OGZ67108.1 MAG: hypothetical protein A3C58_03625 [Candidatus Staskawiczbacteria bacterium RIFCSPHIGHO2_02_FULL_34_10]